MLQEYTNITPLYTTPFSPEQRNIHKGKEITMTDNQRLTLSAVNLLKEMKAHLFYK